METKLLQELIVKSKELMEVDRMYHDFAHANNVLKNAQYLIEKVGGDEVVLYTSALFHDIARDKENHDVVGAKQLRSILDEISDFPKNKIDETCLAVEHHEKGQETHNEKVLSDADKIDAFNELGIGRGFMMQAIKGYKLKDAVQAYIDLLDKWYKGFYFDCSREYVSESYKEVEIILAKMLSMYK